MKHLLAQGLGDAVGFVVGALLGFFAGQLLGCDVFDAGYSTRSMVGIALVGLGGHGIASRSPLVARESH